MKEWCVRFKLNVDSENATYIMQEPGNQWVYIQTPELIKLANNSKVCADAATSESLNRAKVGDDRLGSAWTEEGLQAIGTKLGEYYYFGAGGQPCFGTEEDFQIEANTVKEVGAARASLSSLSKGVSPIPSRE